MRYRRARAGFFALLGGVGLVTVSSPGAGALSAGRFVLADTATPAVSQSPLLGPVAAATILHFEVVLKPRNATGAQAFALAVSTPGSELFRRYLTPAQWESLFSPTTGQVARTVAWLRSCGLEVGPVSGDRLAIDVSGTSARVERTFDTTLAYHLVDGRPLRLAQVDLSVPRALAGIVAGALGVTQTPAAPGDLLDGSPRAATRQAARVAASRSIPPPPETTTAPPCGRYIGQIDTATPRYGRGYPDPLPDVACGYSPSQLRSAYGVTGLVDNGTDGTGQSVAVIDAYASPTLLSDAQRYASLNDPAHPLDSSQFTEVVAKSFDDIGECQASDWFTEQTLDVEAVHSIAPGAHIVYVGAQNCDDALYDSLRTVVDDHLAEVVTDSWGDAGGDLLDDASLRTAVDDTLVMAAGTGVSVLFASGDDGDEFATFGRAIPDYPPSSPWTTAVGGTTLLINADGDRSAELGWSGAQSYLCSNLLIGFDGCTSAILGTWLPASWDAGSGGGTSYRYAQPTYQRGVVPLALATRNSSVVGSTPMRVEPDVSMDADPSTSLLIGETQTFPDGARYGQYRPAGGTSLSSPLFAGMVALADQAAGVSMGFLNPSLYALPSASPAALYDVVPGGNQALSEVSFANDLNARAGRIFITDIIDYQGEETYCDDAGKCRSRDVALSTATGYDDMTGLGTPGPGFVRALADL